MLVTRFVDRFEELSKLLEYSRRGFYPVLYLYGPEGCGKTRLLKELYNRVREREEFVAIYVDAQSVSNIDEAVYAPPELIQLLTELVQSVHEAIGRAVARLLPYAMRRALERKIRGKHVAVVVDDVARPLGLDMIESYAKKLLDLAEWLTEHGASSVLVVATTSEGRSLEILWRHNYVSISLVWNLPKSAFEELSQQLEPPNRDAVEEAWMLVGGNPRMLLEIATSYKWNAQSWFSKVIERVEAVYRKVKLRNLAKHLEHAVEDPDYLYTEPHPQVEELYNLLLEENMVLYKKVSTLDGSYIARDPDLGVGSYIAWQIPAYRRAFSELLREVAQ